MECAQLNITGGTGTASPTTYSIPGIYSATDPGLLVNIYSMTSASTYKIPGMEHKRNYKTGAWLTGRRPAGILMRRRQHRRPDVRDAAGQFHQGVDDDDRHDGEADDQRPVRRVHDGQVRPVRRLGVHGVQRLCERAHLQGSE